MVGLTMLVASHDDAIGSRMLAAAIWVESTAGGRSSKSKRLLSVVGFEVVVGLKFVVGFFGDLRARVWMLWRFCVFELGIFERGGFVCAVNVLWGFDVQLVCGSGCE